MENSKAITAAVQFTEGNLEQVCRILSDTSVTFQSIKKAFKVEGYDDAAVNQVLSLAKQIRNS